MAKGTPKAEYNNDSIRALKGAERVRAKPAVIFGSDGLEGCEHAFFEILSNSVDEAREGHGKEITVTVYKDRSIMVDDRGRGVPLGWNEKEQRWNWDLIYCEMYAGGKYGNTKNSAYVFSLGTNGLGACGTQYASEFMKVQSFDGTTERCINFKKGEVVGDLIERPLMPKEKRTGTTVFWKPDLEVFTDIAIPVDYYRDTLYRQAIVNAGVKFVLRVEQEKGFSEEVFYYEQGIPEYLSGIVGDTALTELVSWHVEGEGRDREDRDPYFFKSDIYFCFSQKAQLLEYYHNSSYLEHGGSPDKAVRAAFTAAFDKYLKNNNRYSKNESKIGIGDILESLVLVINGFSTEASYENQTKKAISNVFIYETLNDFLRKKLEFYLIENPKAAEAIANQILLNKRSRESAERARIDIRKKLATSNDVTSRVEKFVDCRSKDPNLAELYIVEGDSALTSCKLARAAEYQAIIPVRGKTLNCLKSDYDKIFSNEIVTDLLKVIGCGVELQGKKHKDMSAFDFERLRWSKIIICTDADEDGFQIRTLLLTVFYRLLPTLLEKHKVFIAESPLFEITTKNETLFAYDEFEKAEILQKLGKQKYTLQRSKGLGENEPEMMWQTTMNPETRRLISVSPADAAETDRIFDTLLGVDLPARKQFIAEHGKQYMKDIDV